MFVKRDKRAQTKTLLICCIYVLYGDYNRPIYRSGHKPISIMYNGMSCQGFAAVDQMGCQGYLTHSWGFFCGLNYLVVHSAGTNNNSNHNHHLKVHSELLGPPDWCFASLEGTKIASKCFIPH